MAFLLLTLNFLIGDSIKLVNEFGNSYSYFPSSFTQFHLAIENRSDHTIMYDPAVYYIERYEPISENWNTVYTVSDSMLDAIIVYPKKKSKVFIYIPQSNGYYRISWSICFLDEKLRCREEFSIYHYYYNWSVPSFIDYLEGKGAFDNRGDAYTRTYASSIKSGHFIVQSPLYFV